MFDSAGDIIPGLGEEDFPGFPADDCPEVSPDISRHHSSVADVLKQDPDLYHRLKGLRTPLGTGLARCIKVGMDNRGHHMVKTIGLVAGDEDCYEVFRELFDPVIRRHLDSPNSQICSVHQTNLASGTLSLQSADPSGRFVISSQIRVCRSLRGFRFPPAMTLEERMQIERISVRALEELPGPLQGQYFPLSGSGSRTPGGMSPEDEAMLRKSALLFEAPDSTLRLCTGAARHWPEGRGVFVNSTHTFAAWVNEQEHLRLVAMQRGDQLQQAFTELVRASDALAATIARDDKRFVSEVFSWSNRLGFLTSNPANLGAAMHISIMVKLPQLGSLETESMTPPPWRTWCMQQRVQVRSACNESGLLVQGLYEVSNTDRMGLSEVEIVTLVNEVLRRIVQMELRMEAGQPFTDLMETPATSLVNQVSLDQVISKACATMRYGLATGQLGIAICSAGGEASAALAATAAQVTQNKPLPADASMEQVCAQSLMNSLINAAIITKDDKNDCGGDVVISTTPLLVPATGYNGGGVEDTRKKVQGLLISALEDGSLEKTLSTNEAPQNAPEVGPTPTKSSPVEASMPPPLPTGQFNDYDDNDVNVASECASIDDLKNKLHSKITNALDEGRLDQIMAAANGTEDVPIEDLRNRLHMQITTAVDDGTLDQIMQSSLSAKSVEPAEAFAAPQPAPAAPSPPTTSPPSMGQPPNREAAANIPGVWHLKEHLGAGPQFLYEFKVQPGGEVLGQAKPINSDTWTTSLKGSVEGERLSWTEFALDGDKRLGSCSGIVDDNGQSLSGSGRLAPDGADLQFGGTKAIANISGVWNMTEGNTRANFVYEFTVDGDGQVVGRARSTSSQVWSTTLKGLLKGDQLCWEEFALDGGRSLGSFSGAIGAGGQTVSGSGQLLPEGVPVSFGGTNDTAPPASQQPSVAVAAPLSAQSLPAVPPQEQAARSVSGVWHLKESNSNADFVYELTHHGDGRVVGQARSVNSQEWTTNLQGTLQGVDLSWQEFARDGGRRLGGFSGTFDQGYQTLAGSGRLSPEGIEVSFAGENASARKGLQAPQGPRLQRPLSALQAAQPAAASSVPRPLSAPPKPSASNAGLTVDTKTRAVPLEEELRVRARETLVKAAMGNDLERALLEVQGERVAASASMSLEEQLRVKARETLVKASVGDGLERALAEVQQDRQGGVNALAATPVTKDTSTRPTPAAPTKLGIKDVDVADKPAVLWALDAVSHRDRRVGELLAMISETQRSILERDEQCQAIEEKISATRVDLQHLELDAQWHRQAIEGAMGRSMELGSEQRKLCGELDGCEQKLRHANIEETCLMTAQSGISTATGGGTISSAGCYTPRDMRSVLQDPLSPPLSCRW